MIQCFVIFITCTLILKSEAVKEKTIIDLTYTFNNENTPTYPPHTKFNLTLVVDGFKLKDEGNVSFYQSDFTTSEHTGTHIDAPKHIGKSLQSIDNIPLEKLYRIPGIMIDVSKQAEFNADYAINVNDIENWIAEHGAIPDGSVIVFRTGWDKKGLRSAEYFGFDADQNMHFPGIGPEAATWIINYKNSSPEITKGIFAVALDTASLDPAADLTFKSHGILLEAGIFGVENTANVFRLPAKGFTITMLPMKIGDGTGSPTRIIAEINGITFASDASSGIRLNYSYRKSTIITLILCLCASTRFS